MQTATLQYKQIKKIKDERFDEELLQRYNLLVHVGTRDLQTAVIDSSDDRLVLLEDYVLPNVGSKEDLMVALEHVYDSHPLLRAGFWNEVKIGIKNQKFVQIPVSLFVEEAAADVLQFNAALDPEQESVMHVYNNRTEAVTVFSMWEDLKLWLQKMYPAKRPIFLHQSAALIEGVLEYAQYRTDEPLYIYVDRFKLHVLYCQNGQLVYYNQFAIKQFADYIKYIMLVIKSLGMDQRSSRVVLWGYIGKNSPHYHEFYKYISNVTFGHRPEHLQFGYMFDEVQDHHFFDLYSMHLVNR